MCPSLIEIGSMTAEKNSAQTNKQTNKHTDRHYENNGHLAVNRKLECGTMPNVMAALPNIGGAFCKSSLIPYLVPHRKICLTPTARVPIKWCDGAQVANFFASCIFRELRAAHFRPAF